jgi:signal transduction histidine kinase/DNA-binding response OmpR family regulator
VTVATFGADLMFPLGYAVWILYLAPVALCYYAVQPRWVIATAAVCSALLFAGFVLSSANSVAVPFARFNRALGFVVVWTIATLTYGINAARARMRKQAWMQRAAAELSVAVQGHPNLEALATAILQFVARYLDAHAGVLYLAQSGSIYQVAALAAPNDQPRRFRMGEGLVGQVAQDRQLRVVLQLPSDYLPVRSGLGQASPSSLLLVPLGAAGEDVVGVLELAHLHESYPEDAELLSDLAERISVMLRAADQQQRVRELLAETQTQAEELQAQQEELRVANEELLQQTEMQRTQAMRLEEQQEELTQTNAQVNQHAAQVTLQRDELMRAQEELERRAEQLAQASQYKSEFLANMSHELRTPLNSALILSKLLADNAGKNLSDEQVQYARNIHTAGHDLLELINDILDLSKVEAGKMEVVVDLVVPSRLVGSLKDTFEPLAAQKGLKLTLNVAPDAPASIETDSQRLRQILRNLLANALKFTERGEVALNVFRVGDKEIGFEVRDTGIGIAPGQHAVIFEAFQQADGTTSRKYGGTGLGLTISREFSRLLRGRIALDSELGKGSSFCVILPNIFSEAEERTAPRLVSTHSLASASVTLAAPPAAERPRSVLRSQVADDRGDLNGRRKVLIVEDDPIFATLLRDLSHELGFAALVTDSADQGLELATQHHPLAILLDVKLVDHSGLTVLDRAKHSPALRHIPIHVMSADNHLQHAMEMGAASYLLKPIMREQLVGVLQNLEGRFGARARRVLVAEDNAIDRDSICSLLRSEQVETVPVSGVEDAFRELTRSTYDCLVLDLSLGDGTGFELLERMSNDESCSFPPTVIYTGRALSQEEEVKLRRYSSAIIIKGARSPERLLDEVTLFLHQVEASLPASQRRMLEKVRSREGQFADRSVLIVEDDIRNIFALTSVLEAKQVKLRIARNGREALDLLRADSDVDIVLMDIMMPEMDGLTAMREIRKDPATRKLPIIALTAKAMPDDMLRCVEAGANDYIAKPLDVDKLLSLMRVWMPRRSALPLGFLERV